MSAWIRIREAVKEGGLIYTCQRGHEFHQSREALAACINAKGSPAEIKALDRPETCAACSADDAALEAALKGEEGQ